MISRLPPEMILAILRELSIPLAHDTKYEYGSDEAKKTLASCSLVSRTWRAMAQPMQFITFGVALIEASKHYDAGMYNDTCLQVLYNVY